MKVAIVSSQLTYVPDNYRSFYRTLLENDKSKQVAGLILLRNIDFSIMKTILGLRLMGATEISAHLFKNLIHSPRNTNQNIFTQHGLWVKTFNSMNDANAISWIKDQEIDLIVNARTRCIYKKEILETPKLGCINIHHGLLPEYRGTLCDLYALSESRNAGFSIHQMTSKIDAGIIFKKEIVSNNMKNYPEYLDLAAKREGIVLAKFLNEVSQLEKLPEGLANHCEKPIYTRNPTREQIKKFLKQGFKI